MADGKPEIDQSIVEFFKELFGANHRAGAIVAAAQVEDMLGGAILNRMKTMTKPEEQTLFEGTRAPLSSFFAKIHIGYALNLFTEPVRDDLIIIKDVRNLFAHEISVRNFDDPKVKKLCSKLNYPHSVVDKTRNRGFRKPVDISDSRDVFEATSSHLYEMFQIEQNKLLHPPHLADGYGSISYQFRPSVLEALHKKAQAKPARPNDGRGRRTPKKDGPPRS